MKYHVLFAIFEKAAKFETPLLQIIGGTLWVKLQKKKNEILNCIEKYRVQHLLNAPHAR